MPRTLNTLWLGLAVLLILTSTSIYAEELRYQDTEFDYYAIIKKRYLDRSKSPDRVVGVYFKVVYKPIDDHAYSKKMSRYFFHQFEKAMNKRGWRQTFYILESEHFPSYHDWLAEVATWDDHLVIEPEVAGNLLLESNLVVRTQFTNVGDCNYTIKYREGGKFSLPGEKRKKVLLFSNQGAIDDYFQKIIQKMEDCIGNKYPYFEELKHY